MRVCSISPWAGEGAIIGPRVGSYYYISKNVVMGEVYGATDIELGREVAGKGHRMETDRNLLFGVLVLQADLIETGQFVEACTLWAARKTVPLAELLVERGWLSPDDRAHVDHLVEARLKKYGGDARAVLCRLPEDIKRSLAGLGDADIQHSLSDPTAPDGVWLPRTLAAVDVPARHGYACRR